MTLMRMVKAAVVMSAMLFGCAPDGTQPVGPPALPPVLPFDQAVESAANAVLSANAASGGPQVIVIDPLVDGVTGEQSVATRRIGERIQALVRTRYPAYRVAPFTAQALAQRPLVMVGTFTAVNGANQTSGERQAYRFCLVLADLSSGRIMAKGVARAALAGVDARPAGAFRDSPAWSEDPQVRAYVNTCQATRVGDAIPPDYLRGIEAAALVQEGVAHLEAGRLQEALAKYEAARATEAGDQLRVLNGLYMVNRRMRREREASAALGRLVDYGLANQRLGLKLAFQPGSTGFAPGPDAALYAGWLRMVAERAAARNSCLEVRGHTSSTGVAAVNDRLSTLRAEAVRTQLIATAPALAPRLIAVGVGGREPLIGTGRDDASDALDRRVEFRVLAGCG